MRRWSGFTFIELLLALLITALIATSAYSALSGFLQAREVHQQKADELARLQRFFSLLSRDIRQAAPLVNRGVDGELEDALIIGQDGVWVLARCHGLRRRTVEAGPERGPVPSSIRQGAAPLEPSGLPPKAEALRASAAR